MTKLNLLVMSNAEVEVLSRRQFSSNKVLNTYGKIMGGATSMTG